MRSGSATSTRSPTGTPLEVCGGVDGIALTHVDIAERVPDLRLCRGYLTHDGVLRRLVPGPFRDLEYQESLTSLVSEALPLLDSEAPVDWAAAVEAAVGAPVVLTSHGPTVRDKMLRSAVRRRRGDTHHAVAPLPTTR